MWFIINYIKRQSDYLSLLIYSLKQLKDIKLISNIKINQNLSNETIKIKIS